MKIKKTHVSSPLVKTQKSFGVLIGNFLEVFRADFLKLHAAYIHTCIANGVIRAEQNAIRPHTFKAVLEHRKAEETGAGKVKIRIVKVAYSIKMRLIRRHFTGMCKYKGKMRKFAANRAHILIIRGVTAYDHTEFLCKGKNLPAVPILPATCRLRRKLTDETEASFMHPLQKLAAFPRVIRVHAEAGHVEIGMFFINLQCNFIFAAHSFSEIHTVAAYEYGARRAGNADAFKRLSLVRIACFLARQIYRYVLGFFNIRMRVKIKKMHKTASFSFIINTSSSFVKAKIRHLQLPLSYGKIKEKGGARVERLIFHIDVNSAYLSWEAVRHLEKTGEDIRLIPSAIGGDREKRTGVILAKSIPSKKFGIKTGEPVAMALRKCPSLFLAKPDFRLYERSSAAFMEICRDYTPVLEKFSIDECFLDMTGTELLFPNPVKTAHEIQDRIRRELGFTVNIGIGENKLLAKMASDFEKPDRVHTLFRHEIEKKLWPLPVDALFMAGRSTAEKLKKLNVNTIGEIVSMGVHTLESVFGPRLGAQLFARASGEDDSPVLAVPEKAKGYSISTTLEEDVETEEAAQHILLALSDSVAARMRADGASASCIAVTIRANDFKNHSHQETLSAPTDGTMEIYEHACRLFHALWDRRTPLRLLGISLTQLSREESAQFSFFTDEKREKEEQLDKTMDSIRARFGRGTLSRGTLYRAPLSIGKKYEAETEAIEKRQSE